MLYRISTETDLLRADVFHRETAEEARAFFHAVADYASRRPYHCILISVHASSPLFTVERSGFFAEFGILGTDPERRIALVADSEELNHSNEYFALLAQHQGMNVRHFREEPAALQWLRPGNGEPTQDADGLHPDL
jgi:hypothetical protein